MEFTVDQVSAFRYWIQGYPNFYESIVQAYFQAAGCRVLHRPALAGPSDIQEVVDALFGGHRRWGRGLDDKALRRHLSERKGYQNRGTCGSGVLSCEQLILGIGVRDRSVPTFTCTSDQRSHGREGCSP